MGWKGWLLAGGAIWAMPAAASVPSELSLVPASTGPEVTISSGAGYGTFLAADFAQYAPVTALDMVRRIPGFSIQEEDTDSRGFGQARGNVLIDGQRISAKSSSVEASLGRIAAARVVRIDVVDGSRLGVPGLSGRVVNVFTEGTSASTHGTWFWRGLFREDLPPSVNELTLTLSGGKGDVSWSFEAESGPGRSAHAGWRTLRDAQGTLLEQRNEDYTSVSDSYALAGSLAWRPASGKIANLNARVEKDDRGTKLISKTYPLNGEEGRRLLTTSAQGWEGEIGADYEFSAGPGRLKLIGLAQHEHSLAGDLFTSANLTGTGRSASNFHQTLKEGEYILRGEYGLPAGAGQDWQLTAEGAFNYLEGGSELRESEAGGPWEMIPLDLSNTRVEERRAEVMLSHRRQLTPRLTLQVSGGLEYSELSQSGDAHNLRRFTRPKGFASLSWDENDSLTFVTRLERKVGQLNFSDFISSVNLDQENRTGGNPEIVPEQSWRLEGEAQKDFSDWGISTLKLVYEVMEDVVEQVPVGTGSGPGNLDRGMKFGVETESTVRLSGLGMPGGELILRGGWYDMETEDPVTGTDRGLNGHDIYDLYLELRQDVQGTDWTWGGTVEAGRSQFRYRVSEVSFNHDMPAAAAAFLEHKDIAGMTGRVTLGNLLNTKDTHWRQVYAPDRSGNLIRTENYSRAFGPVLTLELRGTF